MNELLTYFISPSDTTHMLFDAFNTPQRFFFF